MLFRLKLQWKCLFWINRRLHTIHMEFMAHFKFCNDEGIYYFFNSAQIMEQLRLKTMYEMF